MSSANELKEQGNKLFIAGKFKEAVSFYTKAIVKNANVSTFYTNRALCLLKLHDAQGAMADSLQALALEPSSVKAQVFIGQAHLELDNLDEAFDHLQQAHKMAREQNLMFGDDIAALIRQVKKRRFIKQEAARAKHETELQQFLNRLLSEHRDRQLDLLQSDPQSASSNYAKRKEEIETEYATRVKQVGEVFDQIDQQRKTRDVPDHLCGKISFELMQEPVITPSGITYDRKDINEHLQRVGHFDPITRQPLISSQLIPNLAMKEVVDYYLEENPWALDGY